MNHDNQFMVIFKAHKELKYLDLSRNFISCLDGIQISSGELEYLYLLIYFYFVHSNNDTSLQSLSILHNAVYLRVDMIFQITHSVLHLYCTLFKTLYRQERNLNWGMQICFAMQQKIFVHYDWLYTFYDLGDDRFYNSVHSMQIS